jgi:hypothetical protein
VSVMTRKQSAAASARMQRQARKIAIQASKLADQAGPVTMKAAMTARQRAGDAAEWARPTADLARAWMALQATRGSASVQETVAPRVSLILESAARRLDPPKPKARRLPKVLAGLALLAAGAAAAAAIAMRSGQVPIPPPMPPRPPSKSPGQTDQVLNPSAEAGQPMTESEVNGLSRST